MLSLPLDKIDLVSEVNGSMRKLTALSLGLTIYFPIPFVDCRAGVHLLFERYLARIGWSNFTFQNMSGTAKGFRPTVANSRNTIQAWFEGKRDYGDTCSIWLKDGTSELDAGGNLFNLFARERGARSGDSNFLRICFHPNEMDADGADEFIAWIMTLLEELPFHSAHLGFTLATSTLLVVSPWARIINDQLYSVGRRFLGVEIEKPHLENYDMREYARSPSWVTFLSESLVSRLGGTKILEEVAGDSTLLRTRFGQGIRVGPAPVLIDRNRNESIPAEMRRLANLMEPLYSPAPAKLFSNKDASETNLWHRRLLG